eukprot:COSAG04_NODE_3275_length_2989_cov_2.414879_6_plen_91_part_01
MLPEEGGDRLAVRLHRRRALRPQLLQRLITQQLPAAGVAVRPDVRRRHALARVGWAERQQHDVRVRGEAVALDLGREPALGGAARPRHRAR